LLEYKGVVKACNEAMAFNDERKGFVSSKNVSRF
jgi:hypothetical protein